MGVRRSESASIFAWGPHQTNFQTEVAPSSSPKNYRFLTKDGYAKAKFASGSIDNAGQSTGSSLPDKTYKDRDETTFQADEQLTFQRLGMLAFDSFGVVNTTPIVVSTVTVAHKQIFSLIDPQVASTLPSRPLAQKIGGDQAIAANVIHDARMTSMTVESFSITDGGNLPNLQASTSYRGSGQMYENLAAVPPLTPSGVQFYGTGRHVFNRSELDAEKDINKRGGIASIYLVEAFAGAPIDTECIVRGFNLTVNNNLNVEGGYAGCGLFQDGDSTKGAIAGSLDSNGQTVSFELTIVADSDVMQDFDLTNRIKTGAPFSLKMAYQGPNIGATATPFLAEFKLNKATITDYEWVGLEGGTQGLRLVTAPLAVGNLLPLSLELTSNVESFASYIAPA